MGLRDKERYRRNGILYTKMITRKAQKLQNFPKIKTRPNKPFKIPKLANKNHKIIKHFP